MALGTLVDSNVLLDVFTDDGRWADWSAEHLARAFDAGPVIINPLIYAELSVAFERIEALDDALPDRIQREDLPWDAAFLAARVSLRYRRGGGTRRSPLPDFYIAAHAATLPDLYIAAHAATTGRALLTRDRPRHLDLLPSLEVISPA